MHENVKDGYQEFDHSGSLILVLIEKMYQTVKTVINHMTKHLKLPQKTLLLVVLMQLFPR